MNYEYIWVFNGANWSFPSALFRRKKDAIHWIKKNHLTGTLTNYPIDIPVYDWAIENDYFQPQKEEEKTPRYIGSFSSAALEHEHFEDGEED